MDFHLVTSLILPKLDGDIVFICIGGFLAEGKTADDIEVKCMGVYVSYPNVLLMHGFLPIASSPQVRKLFMVFI